MTEAQQTARVAAIVAESVAAKQNYFAAHMAKVVRAASLITVSFRTGGKLLICGNGGSACDAQHIAGEFVNRFLNPNRAALPALALNTDGGVLTCIGNDMGFEQVFARQVEAFGVAGDILLAITTSGNSPNVIAAAQQAQKQGMKIVGMLGRDGGNIASLCDIALIVPHPDTQRIQEVHGLLGHILCELVEMELFGE